MFKNSRSYDFPAEFICLDSVFKFVEEEPFFLACEGGYMNLGAMYSPRDRSRL